MSEAHQGRSRCVRSDTRFWHELPAPPRFAWAMNEQSDGYAPPARLAVSASPGPAELPALQALGIERRAHVQADAPVGREAPTMLQVVTEISESLKAGIPCLLHCANGQQVSGTALACYVCRYGLHAPLDGVQQQPALSADEAISLARSLRGNNAVDETQVRFFEQSLWAEHVMTRIGEQAQVSRNQSPNRRGRAVNLSHNTHIVRQPGDGNCLFHSLAHSLGGVTTARALRKRICKYMSQHPGLEISGTSLTEWVKMASHLPLEAYVQRMEQEGEWGGAPEIAVCAQMAGVDIWVYQPCSTGFELVAPFTGNQNSSSSSATVCLLYVGRMHYDALEP